MSIALAKLSDEDPTFQVKTDEESGQTLISGMGELQLDIIVDRMRREFKVECNVGNPQVAYRETIRKAVMNQEYTHKKQTGGSGQFAKVLMNFEPLDTENGETYEFVNEVTGGHITKEFIPSIDAGVQEAMESGILAGFPVVGVKVPSPTARSTTSIPPKWPSRSQVPCASRKLPRRPSRSSSSRSWPWKCVLRKSTWAM